MTYSACFGNDIYEYANIKSCISNKKTDCGTSKKQVILSIESSIKNIKSSELGLKKLKERIADFNKILKYIK